jgi:hypothetical protein
MCKRFDENGGYPAELLRYPAVLDGYDLDQRVVAQRSAVGGNHEMVLAEIFEDAAVQYVLVRDLEAGCFDFRVEKKMEDC